MSGRAGPEVQFVEKGRLDHAGVDQCDADASAGALGAQGLGEAAQGEFGCAVQAALSRAGECGFRTHKDQVSAAGLFEGGEESAGDEDVTGEVEVDQGADLVVRELL